MKASLRSVMVAGTLAAALCGCAANAARTRFANEFHCPPDETQVIDLGANSYRVSGCGHEEIYACAGEEGGRVCVRDTGPESVPPPDAAPRPAGAAPAPAGTPAPRDAWRGGRVEFAAGTVGGQPALRLRVRATYDATFTYAPARDPERILVALVAPPTRADGACNGASLQVGTASVAFEPAGGPFEYDIALDAFEGLPEGYFRLELCGTTTDLVSLESGGARRFFNQALSQRSAAREHLGLLSATPAGAGAGEDGVRAWIDSHRAVILACVPSGVVVATVEPGPGGPVFALRPPHHDTPEERCARAAVGTPPPVDSAVIHALTRP